MDLRIVFVSVALMAGVMAADDVIAYNDVTTRDVVPGVGEYFYIGIALNWTEAMLLCQASNAHLAVIDSAAEAAAIRQLLTKNGASSIHLGFHDQFVEGKYIDVLGESLSTGCGGSWASQAPVGGVTNNCGAFSDAGMTDARCQDKLPFICEIPTQQNATNSLSSYTLIPNFGRYKRYAASTWYQADDACREEGTHLLIINSEQEIEALTTEGLLRRGSSYFVGVHRIFGGNDNFRTVHGDTLTSTGYSTWYSSQPTGTFLTAPFVFFYLGQEGNPTGLGTSKTAQFFICEQEL